MAELKVGDQVEVIDEGLAMLRRLCPGMPPNHRGRIEEIDGEDGKAQRTAIHRDRSEPGVLRDCRETLSATSAVLGQGNAADKKRRRENVTITNQPKAVVFFNGLLRSRPVKP